MLFLEKEVEVEKWIDEWWVGGWMDGWMDGQPSIKADFWQHLKPTYWESLGREALEFAFTQDLKWFLRTSSLQKYSKTFHHGHNTSIYKDKGDMFSTKTRVLPQNPGDMLSVLKSHSDPTGMCGLPSSGQFQQKVGLTFVTPMCHISFPQI